MNPSSRSRGTLMTLVLSALASLLLLAACTPATPTLTSTPSPTPTPTPIPDPIAGIRADATFGDLVAVLPDDVKTCLRTELGAQYEALLGKSIFDTTLNMSAQDLPLECFDRDSLVDLFMASLSQTADGLSSETLTCLRDAFAGVDVEALSSMVGGNIGNSASDALGAGIGMLVCLTDDEAESITAGSLLGDSFAGAGISLKDIRCVFQSVDLNQLVSLIESVSAGDGTAVPDLSQMLELYEATQKCGIDLQGLMGDASSNLEASDAGEPFLEPIGTVEIPALDLSQIDQLSPELQAAVRCLIEAVGGEENAQGFLDGTYTPALPELIAMGQCNVDLSQLGELAAQ